MALFCCKLGSAVLYWKQNRRGGRIVDKETLTTWQIKRFIRRFALKYMGLSVLFMILPVITGLLCLLDDDKKSLYAHICFAVFFLIMSLFFLGTAIGAVMYAFRKPIMVIATHTGPPVGDDGTYHIYGQKRWFRLYFHGYGSFMLYDYMYYDSEYNDMTDGQLWRSTCPGDKFYLLLWKESGGIMQAYPCNNFAYAGELTPSKYEK